MAGSAPRHWKRCVRCWSGKRPLQVAERLVRRREPFYRRLAQVDPTQNRFLQGWLNRVEKLKTASGIA